MVDSIVLVARCLGCEGVFLIYILSLDVQSVFSFCIACHLVLRLTARQRHGSTHDRLSVAAHGSCQFSRLHLWLCRLLIGELGERLRQLGGMRHRVARSFGVRPVFRLVVVGKRHVVAIGTHGHVFGISIVVELDVATRFCRLVAIEGDGDKQVLVAAVCECLVECQIQFSVQTVIIHKVRVKRIVGQHLLCIVKVEIGVCLLFVVVGEGIIVDLLHPDIDRPWYRRERTLVIEHEAHSLDLFSSHLCQLLFGIDKL